MQDSNLLTETETQDTYVKQFLSIGEVIIAPNPAYIWTVLGSCVSVILFSPHRKISAICHAQLVEKEFQVDVHNQSESWAYKPNSTQNDFRYLACSVYYMIDQLLKLGIRKHEIVASIYGGAHVIGKIKQNIGSENADSAHKILEDQGIRVVKKDVGGNKSRTIRFFSDTGVINVKYLDSFAS
jgi:chemotaxis protein CheD